MSEEEKIKISKLAITSVLCGIYPFLFMLSRMIFSGKGPRNYFGRNIYSISCDRNKYIFYFTYVQISL